MFSRPDPQSFTKFVLSAGAFLVIAGFVIPGLVLRETGVLRTSEQELSRLTPLARQEIERRQRIERSVGIAAPYAGLLFFVLGGALIVYGAPRLKRQEEADEERFGAELDKLRSEIEPQSASEREERLKEGVEEDLSAARSVTTSSDELPEPLSRELSGDFRQRMLHRAAVESQVLGRLAQIAPPNYELQSNVKLSGTHVLLLDGLLVSAVDRLPDIVVEIKLAGLSLRQNARNRVNDALSQVVRYRTRLKRPTIGWIIMVSDVKVPASELTRLQSLALDFAGEVHVSLITLEELPSLSLPLA